MSLLITIILLCLCIILVCFIFNKFIKSATGEKTVYFQSSIDNEKYLVRDLKDKQNASDLLAEIKRRLTILIEKVCKTNTDYCDRLSNFKIHELAEANGENKYNSHTMNKSQVNLCLRCRTCGDTLEDINTLMFVAIHELAHIICTEFGHVTGFWDIMRKLLKIAMDNGLYTYHDYRLNPQTYCNTVITDTPLH